MSMRPLRLQVYEMAVDTILLCFCEDCEANQGHPQHAPELLQHAIGLAHGMAAGGKASGAARGCGGVWGPGFEKSWVESKM